MRELENARRIAQNGANELCSDMSIFFLANGEYDILPFDGSDTVNPLFVEKVCHIDETIS